MGSGRISSARPLAGQGAGSASDAGRPVDAQSHQKDMDARAPSAGAIECDIPARLERLPWGSFHSLVVIALGVTWILDGLEVTLAGALAGALKQSPILQFSNTDVGFA